MKIFDTEYSEEEIKKMAEAFLYSYYSCTLNLDNMPYNKNGVLLSTEAMTKIADGCDVVLKSYNGEKLKDVFKTEKEMKQIKKSNNGVLHNITSRLMKLDEPSPFTGVVYTTEAVAKFIEEQREVYNQIGLFGFGEMVAEQEPYYDTFVPLENIAFAVDNLYIDNDRYLCVDVSVLDTPRGRILNDLINQGKHTTFSFHIYDYDLVKNGKTTQVNGLKYFVRVE